MIIVAAFLLVVLSVPLCGGSFRSLATLRTRRAWSVVAAMGIQIAIINLFSSDVPASVAGALHLASYGLALVFLHANRRVAGMWLIVLGGGMNLAAIAANDGIMPASAGALEAAGRSHDKGEFQNSTTVDDAKLAFLGDTFAWPEPMPLANVFSLGDLLLILGAGVTMHTAAQSRLTREAHRRRDRIDDDELPTAHPLHRRPVPDHRRDTELPSEDSRV